VVMVDAQPVLYLERGGRALKVLAETGTRARGACHPASVEPDRAASHAAGPLAQGRSAGPEDARVRRALTALAEHAHAGRLAKRIALERVEGEPVLGSPWQEALERSGFRVGPRRVELAAS